MDCGPACLKSLLEGFGRAVSYGRLREACQTGLDGTSIDTMEEVANQLGLQAEQIMLPIDHLLLDPAKTLPAIVVVKLPSGLTHFVVAWRLHGNMIQLMDPAVGRRWTRVAQFGREVYSHTMPAPAADWREFAASPDFQHALQMRFGRIGVRKQHAEPLISRALEQKSWRGLAALDAGVRLAASLLRAGGLGGSRDVLGLIAQLCAKPELIPARYWSVAAQAANYTENTDGEEQLLMRGAVLVRITAKHAASAGVELGPELEAAIAERPLSPARELIRLVAKSGLAAPGILTVALAAGAGAVVIEALLFRALFDITGDLRLTGQRAGALAAILLFSFALLLLEVPAFSGALRLGRQIENRLRVAFLSKIPKLGDRYFQSRLTSDMAERSHATHRLRHLPDLARQLLRNFFELCATAAGIIWLDPAAAPFILLAVAAALLPTFAAQPILAERDLRVRSHAAALTRFYLDALLGLIAIRAHSAGESVRREHQKLLGEWAGAALRLQKTMVAAEAVQMTATFGLVAALLLVHPLDGMNIGRVLLLAYWALNLPSLGQEIAALARQYPSYRNLSLRLLEPLGAPEEAGQQDEESLRRAPLIEFRGVQAEAAGHTILEHIDVRIEPASQVAIVGESGAGKSSLVGILLGWLKPSRGEVLISGVPLNSDALRQATAWVDPAVQLWNRSLFSNLRYGSDIEPAAVRKTIDVALLRGVLESLPEGFETKLGEGGTLVSGGEGQRVRFGRALLRRDARLVILDEPFRGLDREKRRELLHRAREFWRGATILCITHDLSETRGFERVLVIERGRIIEDGAPEELRAAAESRYSQMLEAEQQTRSGMWCGGLWRRIHIHAGRVVEEHTAAEELPENAKRREPEVA